jgi:hypothetical protein
MFEIIFMEELGVDKNDDILNQFGSISNIELSPIYGKIAIVKTSYKNGELKNSLINDNDINEIIVNNFYHTGIMINSDGSLLELEFSGDNPNLTIGGNFKQMDSLSLFGLVLIGYNETNTTNEINKIASKIYGKEIRGRIFLTTMCPITNKRFWSLNIDIFNNIFKLVSYLDGTQEQKNKINELEKELTDDKLKNPFFLIKKYCV